MKILKTNPDTGIFNRESYESRRQAFGDNDKKPPILKKWWEILLEALDDATLKILIVAAIVSISKSFKFKLISLIFSNINFSRRIYTTPYNRLD